MNETDQKETRPPECPVASHFEEIRAAVRRFINGHFGRTGQEGPRIGIPADPKRDDDIVLMAFIGESAATYHDWLTESKRRAEMENDIIQTLGVALDFPKEDPGSDLIDGCGLVATEIAEKAAEKLAELKKDNADLRMKFMQLTSTLTRLKAWDEKYPKGTVYPSWQGSEIEGELTAIIDDLISIVPSATMPETVSVNDSESARYIESLLKDWPRDPGTGRLICTTEKPLPDLPEGHQSVHPEAKSVGPDDPYYDHYKCPACGLYFSVEVAE